MKIEECIPALRQGAVIRFRDQIYGLRAAPDLRRGWWSGVLKTDTDELPADIWYADDIELVDSRVDSGALRSPATSITTEEVLMHPEPEAFMFLGKGFRLAYPGLTSIEDGVQENPALPGDYLLVGHGTNVAVHIPAEVIDAAFKPAPAEAFPKEPSGGDDNAAKTASEPQPTADSAESSAATGESADESASESTASSEGAADSGTQSNSATKSSTASEARPKRKAPTKKRPAAKRKAKTDE